MKISHKLILALLGVCLPLALASVVVTFFIHRQIRELGSFHTASLYVIQSIRSEAMGAVEESFAYIVSGDPKEKQLFFEWAGGFAGRMGDFERIAKPEPPNETVEREFKRKILSGQKSMVERAVAMFREQESRGKMSAAAFNGYEEAVNQLRADIDGLIRHEKHEVDATQEKAVRLIRYSESAILFLAAGSAMLAILAGIFVSRTISRPISKLKAATGQIARGDFEVETASDSKDELGDLGRSISRMAQDLSQRREDLRLNQELQALREIDRAIMSSLDLRTVLDVLLKKIDLFLPHSATTIRLLNESSGVLEPVACWNLDDKEWRAEEWSGGRGIPNAVFTTKAVRILPNVQTDPSIRDPEFFRRHGLVSYLGIPLIVQEKILGVISFYTREAYEFAEHDIQFLTSLAGQAAIAINNSRIYEAMAKSNKVKDEFLSVMSHELRTPLSVIMGYIGMMKERILGEINPKQEEALQKVLGRANDQLGMIDAIMQTTQIESRGMVPEKQLVNLTELLVRLQSDCELIYDKHRVPLHWSHAAEAVLAVTDGAKVKQILINLISNAVRFTYEGEVTVALGVTRENGKNHARFRVADTGIGMAQDEIPRIFDKFYQVDSSETRVFGGVGLGLYIVEKFAELLGGTVGVESEPGEGTTFTFTIPCDR